jgi:glycosyltransferase involved in cell wall biosynthesis
MSTRPLVSCICVTKNRRMLVRKAVEYFERSRYLYWVAGGKAELVIVDGSAKPFDIFGQADVRYVHHPSAEPRTGHFHNVACEEAKGDVIIQWDDDDWHHPYRIVRQSATLEAAGGDAFTFSSAFWWYHVSSARACRAKSWGPGMGSTGALFAYNRATWKAAPFRDDADQAEDIGWCQDHRARGTPFLDSEDPALVIYMRHNVNGSALTNYQFRDDDTAAARDLMGSDVDFYDELAELLPLTPWNHPNAPGSKAHALSPLQLLHLRHYR